MKSALALLLIATHCVPGYAEDAEAIFCKEYKKDQTRISEVKNNGWVKGAIKKDYLYGCLDLNWREQLYQNICLNKKQEIKLPQAIMFYFDGFGNFLPETAKWRYQAVNITGKEPKGYNQGGLYFLDNVFSTLRYQFSLREDFDATSTAKKFDIKEDIQFHYYSGSGTDKIMGIENASACYSSMLKDLKLIEEQFPSLKQPKKIIMGYSNGGDSAIKFVNQFTTEENEEFDILATLDPVPRAGGFIKNKITFSETVFKLENPDKISYSINLYQKTNEAVMAGFIGIKGSKVEGVNFEKEYSENHSYILLNSDVAYKIASSIATLYYPEISEEDLTAKRNAKLKKFIESDIDK